LSDTQLKVEKVSWKKRLYCSTFAAAAAAAAVTAAADDIPVDASCLY